METEQLLLSISPFGLSTNSLEQVFLQDSVLACKEGAEEPGSVFLQPYRGKCSNCHLRLLRLQNALMGLIAIVCICQAVGSIIEDRVSGLVHLQQLVGLHPLVYWVAEYLYGLLFFSRLSARPVKRLACLRSEPYRDRASFSVLPTTWRSCYSQSSCRQH